MTSCTIGQGYYEGYSHQRGCLPPWISTESDDSITTVPKMNEKFINNNEDDIVDKNNDRKLI